MDTRDDKDTDAGTGRRSAQLESCNADNVVTDETKNDGESDGRNDNSRDDSTTEE